MAGKLIGSNFASRLLRILPWAESQMGKLQTEQVPQPQILATGKHRVKLHADLAFDDAAGVTGTIWTGKPAEETTREIKNIVADEEITTSGTFSEDAFVWIERIGGLWFVTGYACD